MPHFIRVLSRRSYQVFDCISLHYQSCRGWPRLDNICLYFGAKPEPIRVHLEILRRHRFVELVDDRYQAVDRKPLLMPYWGDVK